MRLLRNVSIKSKLIVLAAVSVSTALLLCCVAFIWNDAHTLLDAKRRQVDSLAMVLGSNIISAIEFDDAGSAEETLSSLVNQPTIESAIVFDADGNVFATYPADLEIDRLLAERPASGVRYVSAAGHIDVVQPILCSNNGTEPLFFEGVDSLELKDTNALDPMLAAGPVDRWDQELVASTHRPIGEIMIRAGTEDIAGQIVSRSVATLFVLIGSLVIGLIIAVYFQRMITTPVNDLVATAREIAEYRDFSRRAKKHGEDELGQLCDAFNGMLTELQFSREQIQTAHDELELRVVERTAELKEAMNHAMAASRAKSDFLANMSHEIRTPMTAILGFTDLLADETVVSPLGRERIDTIQRNSRHLLTIVNDILDVSKIEAGKMSVECVECSICELLVDLISLLRPRAASKGLQLEIEFENEIPERIWTDPTRLRQILVNLIGNAIKFTEQGSIKLVVALQTATHDGRPRLQCSIVDTGIGLCSEQIRSVFDAFTQADETMTRRFGGTGLGLTISRGLAQLLGGELSVTSELGIGSTFAVTVETGSLEGVAMFTNVRESQKGNNLVGHLLAATPRPQAIEGRILLVEDGIDNQTLISFLLKKAGAEVSLAENGQVGHDMALEAWRGGTAYDLIFMDMQMPVLDGYAATRQLREANYALPIVALTAHAMSHDRAKCLDAGCDDFVTKPVDRAELIAMAAQWIERSKLLAAYA